MKRITNPFLEQVRDYAFLEALCFDMTSGQSVYLIRFRFLKISTYFFIDSTGNYILRPNISDNIDKKRVPTLYKNYKEKNEKNPWIWFSESHLAKIVSTGMALTRSVNKKNSIEIEKMCYN